MVRVPSLLLAVGLLVSAAAADVYDQTHYNQAVLTHEACTVAAARELAKKDGEPYLLAPEALSSCKAEEAEIARHASHDTLQHVLGRVVWLRIGTILEERAGPRPQWMYCADCGTFPKWDDKLKIWRPNRR
jgi:hypothetical protein